MYIKSWTEPRRVSSRQDESLRAVESWQVVCGLKNKLEIGQKLLQNMSLLRSNMANKQVQILFWVGWHTECHLQSVCHMFS